MSLKILGPGFDIHGGGSDLVFPHHENEIAQAVGAGHEFARHWLHNGMLNVNGEKMSKSLGNFTTLADVLDEYDPRAFRMLVLKTHYRRQMEVGPKELERRGEGRAEPRQARCKRARDATLPDAMRRRFARVPQGDGRRLRHARRRSPCVQTLRRDANVALDDGPQRRRGATRRDGALAGRRARPRAHRRRRRDGRRRRRSSSTQRERGARRARTWPRADRIRDELLERGHRARGHAERHGLAPGLMARARSASGGRSSGRGSGDALGGEQVEGRRAVLELLRAGRREVRSVVLVEHGARRSRRSTRSASSRAASSSVVGPDRIDELARTDAPQGVIATAAPLRAADLDELLARARRVPRRARRGERPAQSRRGRARRRDRGRDGHDPAPPSQRGHHAGRREGGGRRDRVPARSRSRRDPERARARRAAPGVGRSGSTRRRRSFAVRPRARRPAARARARLRGTRACPV